MIKMIRINTILMIFLLAMVCGNLAAQTFWSEHTEPFTAGSGIQGDPYIISTPQQLAYLAVMVRDDHANYANKNYKMDRDIDLSEYIWDLPIGTQMVPFQGKFDGNEKNIPVFWSNIFDYDCWGLFGTTRDAEINRVRVQFGSSAGSPVVSGCLIGYAYKTVVTDCSFEMGEMWGNGDYSGGFIGYAEETTISDCNYSGSMIGWGNFIGGFIGYAEKTTISGCSYSGSLIGYGSGTGGLIGLGRDITLTGCSHEGSITGSQIVGGLVGAIDVGSVTNCYSTGTISGFNKVGGFIGLVESSGTTIITDCYAVGTVVGLSDHIGGFIGNFWGWEGSIERCFAEAKVTGLGNGIGGFIGYGFTYDKDKATIFDCYSISSTSGNLSVGGFIGAGTGLTIDRCYAGGSVAGTNFVGGFSGNFSNSSISHCSTGVATDGGENVGGFVGVLSYSTLNACFAGGKIEGSSRVGSFCGGNYEGVVIDCFAVGGVFDGRENSGGFAGFNSSGNYINCYFDKQTTGILSGTGYGNVVGIEAFTTSQLTQNTLPPDFSEDDWEAVAGYYPQLKIFANSDNATLQAHSTLFAVPLKLANDVESINDVQTFFQLADKTPEGESIIWDASYFEKVTIYNNAVYAEPSNAWRTLTLRTGELERSFKFRAPGGLLSAEIIDVKSNHPAKDNMFTYLIECGSADDFAYADLMLPPYASCTPGSPLILYANTPLVVTVTSIDGQSKPYTFRAEKRLPSDIFIQRWHDVLAINNNFTTNGGYNFTAYEWYKNGEKMSGNTKGYIQEPGGLSRTAEYTAIVTTQQRDQLGICPAKISNMPAPKMAVYPNPARSGQTVRVETGIDAGEQNNAVMQLFNATGNLLAKQTLNAPVVELTAPDTPGTYVLQITVNGVAQTLKIAVE